MDGKVFGFHASRGSLPRTGEEQMALLHLVMRLAAVLAIIAASAALLWKRLKKNSGE